MSHAHARALIPAVLELMSDGRLRPELVTTDLASLDEARRALSAHATGEATKAILAE